MIAEPTRGDGCLSYFVIDQLLAGELDAKAHTSVHAHLSRCSRCRQRLAQSEAERGTWNAALPPLPAGRKAPPPRRWQWQQRWLPAAGIAMAAAAAIALVVVQPAATGVPSSGQNRAKGLAHLGFYVKSGPHVREGSAHEEVHPGDALRFTYTVSESRHLAIISIDGAQKVSVYHPDDSSTSPVSPGTDIALEYSIILDDVLGRETIYGLFCEQSVALATVTESFRMHTDAPPIPDGCTSDIIVLHKRP